MINKLESMIKESMNASEIIRSQTGPVRIVSHYDCDGICSAAIMAKALLRSGVRFRLTLVNQLGRELVDSIAKEDSGLVIFTDIGSGQTALMADLLEKTTVVISDHHQPAPANSNGKDYNKEMETLVKGAERRFFSHHNLVHINPILFGIGEDVSGSGVTYIVARTMSAENVDLGDLAITGAIGDSQTGSIGDNWSVLGLNQEILKDAQRVGVVSVSKGIRLWGRFTRPLHKALELSIDPYIPGISGSESASVQFLNELGITARDGKSWRTLSDLTQEEQKRLVSAIIIERLREKHPNPSRVLGDVYDLPHRSAEFRDAQEFATIVNACGKSGMGYLGFAVCMGDEEKIQRCRETVAGYRKQIGTLVNWVFKNKDDDGVVKRGAKASYVFGGDKINEHLISTVASIVHRSKLLDPGIVTVGFANAGNSVKVSCRTDDESLDLDRAVRRVTALLGGEGGGHSAAAGAIIPAGSEEKFIKLMDEMLNEEPGMNGVSGGAETARI